jgi:16S rRNA (cytosine967-C5)-methyltransferase
VVAALLANESGVRRIPIEAGEVAGLTEILNADGDLRTLPCHLPHVDARLAGLDGFYAARLVKSP